MYIRTKDRMTIMELKNIHVEKWSEDDFEVICNGVKLVSYKESRKAHALLNSIWMAIQNGQSYYDLDRI